MHKHEIIHHSRTTLWGILIGVSAFVAVFAIIVQTSNPIQSYQREDNLTQIPQPVEGFKLSVSKLDIDAPIIPNVDAYNEKEYLAAIEKGVAQMKGSADPNADGNLFIFGHSSYYKWKPGDYKEVFKHLDELKTGEKFSIWFEKQKYNYEVVETKIVADNDWSIANPKIEGALRTVTLMTCWPPGTLQKRLAVIAKQV